MVRDVSHPGVERGTFRASLSRHFLRQLMRKTPHSWKVDLEVLEGLGYTGATEAQGVRIRFAVGSIQDDEVEACVVNGCLRGYW